MPKSKSSLKSRQAITPAAARLAEPALFACRINRAFEVEMEHDAVVLTPSDLREVRYIDIHLDVGRIHDLLMHSSQRNLVIDLSGVSRLEPIAMTALVGFCRAARGAVAFCNVSDMNMELIDAAGLGGLWPCFGDRAEALSALSSGEQARPRRSAVIAR